LGDREPPEQSEDDRTPCPEPIAVFVELRGSIARTAIPSLCERTRDLMSRCDREVVVCDVSRITNPDAVTVDALARLQLTAQRIGHSLWFRNPSSVLRELIDLAGLREVLPVLSDLGLEPQRHVEEREDALGVEEVVEPDDPTA